MEMAAGMSSLVGYRDGEPTTTGPSYVDPIGGNSQQQNNSSGSSGSGSNGPTLSNTPALSAQASPSTAAAPTASSGQTLPRTGSDAGVLAAIGLVALLAGLGLRRRLADERH
jgi:LPXTG-motif cell wall-anchored protein